MADNEFLKSPASKFTMKPYAPPLTEAQEQEQLVKRQKRIKERDKANNPFRRIAARYKERGEDVPDHIKVQADSWQHERDLLRGGVSQGRLDKLKFYATSGPVGLFVGALDVLNRGLFASAGVFDEVVQQVAPEGTAEAASLRKIGNAFVDTLGGDLIGESEFDPEGKLKINRTDETGKMRRSLANPSTAMTAALFTAYKEFSTDEGKEKLKHIAERAFAADTHQFQLPRAAVLRIGKELFSGVGSIKGEKLGYGDVARKMGIKNGLEASAIMDNIIGGDNFMLPLGPGGVPIPFGYTPTGEGLFALKRHGILDPYALTLAAAPADVFLDPTTYTTGGASGAIRALGRPLSKKGAKRLAAVLNKIKEADGLRLAAALPEDSAKLARELTVLNPARKRAAEVVLSEARRDSSLLLPRMQVRWMGMPIANLGKAPGKSTLPARLLQSRQINKAMLKFRDGLLKAADLPAGSVQSRLLRETLEKISGRARWLARVMAPELTDLDEFLSVLAQAQGTAAGSTERISGKLSSIGKLTDNQNDVAIGLLDDIHATAPRGADDQVKELFALNDELGEIYEDLSQEAVIGVRREGLDDVKNLMRYDAGQADTVARKIEKRITEADEVATYKAQQEAHERNAEKIAKAQAEGIELGPDDLEVIPMFTEAKTVQRGELFVSNPHAELLAYTTHLANTLPAERVTSLTKLIKDVADGGVRVQGLDQRLTPWILDLVDLRKTDPDAFVARMSRMAEMEKVRADAVFAIGDRGAFLTPMHRDDLIEILEAMRKQNTDLPRLRYVTDVKEHVFRRSQVAYAKRSLAFQADAAYALSKNDTFARNYLEKHLVSIGELEASPKTNVAHVDEVIQDYVDDQMKRGGRVPVEMEDGVMWKKVEGGPAEPERLDMLPFLERLETPEDMQLFFRKWLLGEGAFDALPINKLEGKLSQRIYLALNTLGDPDEWVATKRAAGLMTDENNIMNRWAEDAMRMREILASKGLTVDDMLPRANLAGSIAFNGDKVLPFRNIKFKTRRGKRTYSITKERTGEPIFLPQSMHRTMERMMEGALGNPEVGLILRGWDAFMNVMKLGLTAIGGYPAFQIRNMYSNVAFGMTGAHLHMINRNSWAFSKRMAWHNSDPAIAFTANGHRNTMRMRVMKDVALQPEGFQDDVYGIADVLKKHYQGGRKQLRKIAEDNKALMNEAQHIYNDMNTLQFTDNFGTEWTRGQLIREVSAQGIDIDPRLLAEFSGITERFHSKGQYLGSFSRGVANVKDKMVDKMLRSNAFFEQWSRQQLFFTFLQQGHGAHDAGRLAKKWMLDYQALAPLEQRMMKRIFPFYTFYRKTVPLMVESLFARTGVMSVQAKVLTMDRHDPEVTWGADQGKRVVLRKDGKAYVMGGVDLPIGALQFVDILTGLLSKDDPGMKEARRLGWKQMATMVHPVIQQFMENASEFEMFSGRQKDQKKLNSLGAGMNEMGMTEEGGWYVRKINRKGEIDYHFNKGLMTKLIGVTGMGRILSNFDRQVEIMKTLPDGDFTRLVRWFSGLNLAEEIDTDTGQSQNEITQSERNLMKLKRYRYQLREEIDRRGLGYQFTLTVTDPPGTKQEAIRKATTKD
jgi:hypothetical protein